MSMKIAEYDNNAALTIKNDESASKEKSHEAKNSSDYSRYLESKYGYFNKKSILYGVSVSVSVSEEYLKKCAGDSDAAKSLEKKLGGFPDHAAGISEKYQGGVKNISYKFDEDGRLSISVILSDEKSREKEKTDKAEDTDEKESEGRCAVAVNAEKRSRQIASAKTQDQIKAVIEMLRQDVSECRDGLDKGWCDENEVAKAEALLQRAMEKQAQMPPTSEEEDDPNAELEFLINSLM